MDSSYFQIFENQLTEKLLKLCNAQGVIGTTLLSTEDIDSMWTRYAPEYVADAIPNIKDYPLVALAWAFYLGMGVAKGWDVDWDATKNAEYSYYYGSQKFDDMDEHILCNILHIALESPEAKTIESVAKSCAQTVYTAIRHEQIEPSTPEAFHVYARSCKALFRIGAAVELSALGYKFEKI